MFSNVVKLYHFNNISKKKINIMFDIVLHCCIFVRDISMEYFKNISSYHEGRLIYRRLARLNHPDLGGNSEIMKRINIDFERFKMQFETTSGKFVNIRTGDFVMVNNSLCIVIRVSKDTFTARSNYTNRQATFSSISGICLSNSKFQASPIKENINAG